MEIAKRKSASGPRSVRLLCRNYVSRNRDVNLSLYLSVNVWLIRCQMFAQDVAGTAIGARACRGKVGAYSFFLILLLVIQPQSGLTKGRTKIRLLGNPCSSIVISVAKRRLPFRPFEATKSFLLTFWQCYSHASKGVGVCPCLLGKNWAVRVRPWVQSPPNFQCSCLIGE